VEEQRRDGGGGATAALYLAGWMARLASEASGVTVWRGRDDCKYANAIDKQCHQQAGISASILFRQSVSRLAMRARKRPCWPCWTGLTGSRGAVSVVARIFALRRPASQFRTDWGWRRAESRAATAALPTWRDSARPEPCCGYPPLGDGDGSGS